MFLLSQSINRGSLRSAGVSRFSAKPLRLHWPPSLAPASSGLLLLRRSTILGYYPLDPGCFTKNLWAFPRLAWLLHRRCQARCCLRPRGVGCVLVGSVRAAWPAPNGRGSALSQNPSFSGLRVRFRASPFTSLHLLLLLSVFFFSLQLVDCKVLNRVILL